MKTMTATGHLQLTLYIHSDSVCHDSTQRNSIKSREAKESTVHITKSLYRSRLEGHTHTRAANQSVAPRVDLEIAI